MAERDDDGGLEKRERFGFPEQVKRLFPLLIIVVALIVSARSFLIPEDFGEYGHFRASALEEAVLREMKYAGRAACADCHDDLVEIKARGFHKNVACEVCHGPAAAHIEDDEAVELRVPRERGYCVLCHEYLPSRPTGFPQIVADTHNPRTPCFECHEPHDPKPPETPQNCSACHATIARTKLVSHHANVDCIVCHETSEGHKIDPRDFIPPKPTTRAFCGSCHGEDADSSPRIPRVDMDSHGTGYVCWQCHYPHLPETQ